MTMSLDGFINDRNGSAEVLSPDFAELVETPIFKEVINNTIKHATAKNIWIELLVFQNIILLNLKDDGKGFNTDAVSQGQGLKSMYRRAGILQGKIKISSEQDKGTAVQLEFVY